MILYKEINLVKKHSFDLFQRRSPFIGCMEKVHCKSTTAWVPPPFPAVTKDQVFSLCLEANVGEKGGEGNTPKSGST